MWKLIITGFSCIILSGCLENPHVSPAETTTREVAQNTAEETARKVVITAFNRAIEKIEQRFSKLSAEQRKELKKGLQAVAIAVNPIH